MKIDTRLSFSLNSESPYHRSAESSTPRLNDTRSRPLSVSVIRGVGDSPTQRYRESATHRITGAGSRWLSISSIQRVFFLKNSIVDSPYQWCGESPTPVSVIAGSHFPNMKSRNWSQILNVSKGSVRDSLGTNFCKNPRKSASLPCPFNKCLCARLTGTGSDLLGMILVKVWGLRKPWSWLYNLKNPDRKIQNYWY